MTDRLPLAQHTKASLDQLYDDLDQARTYADPELHGRLTAAINALGKSETELKTSRAANTRVRNLAARIRQGAPWTACDDDIAAHILRALDGDQAPAEPLVHVGNGANAEDCPACTGTNPPYPFICPGPSEAAGDEADLTGYLAPDPPIGCLTVAEDATPPSAT